VKPPKKDKQSREYPVPALDRGLDVLERLSAADAPMSLSDLARALDYAPSGLFRLLGRLEKRRYIMREPDSGKYSLTLKLFEISRTHSPMAHLVRLSQGPMRDLASEIGESVHLGVLSQGRLVVLLDIAGPARIRIAIEEGSQFSAGSTTSGRLLLAFLSEDEARLALDRDDEYLAMTEPEKASFHEDLARIRECGYSIGGSPQRPGLRDISVLVGNPGVGRIAALATAWFSTGKKQNPDVLLAPMLECARRITLAQGLSVAQ
jgi:DNA-binding IclR family transcriptional regulator